MHYLTIVAQLSKVHLSAIVDASLGGYRFFMLLTTAIVLPNPGFACVFKKYPLLLYYYG
jgi:hypothetical protein